MYRYQPDGIQEYRFNFGLIEQADSPLSPGTISCKGAQLGQQVIFTAICCLNAVGSGGEMCFPVLPINVSLNKVKCPHL